MATTTIVRTPTHRVFLQDIVSQGGRVRLSTALLLLDAVAAIGFAAGLAGAIATLADGDGAVVPWLVLGVLSACVRGVSLRFSTQVGAAGARAAKQVLRARIVVAVLHRPATSQRTAGELAHAAVDEVEAIDGHVARFLPARRAATLGPLIILVAIAFASPVSAAILTATLLPFIVALALAGGAAADESRRQFAALSRLSGLLADRLRALPVVLAFGAQEREAARLALASREVAHRTMRVLRVAFLSSGALEFFAALSVALVAVYCGFNLLGLLPFAVPERLDLGASFFVLALAPEFYLPLRRLAAAYHDRQAAETAAERLAAIEAEQLRAPPLSFASPLPALALDAVAIRYPGADNCAVAGFSLAVAPGEMIALVGASGSGKTSLLHLLLGLAPIERGRILVDRQPLPPGASLARQVAWLGQSTLLLPDTIAANIALAHPAASRDDVARAAQAAGLAAMLACRLGGLDTMLDERGSGLSGGERRRIGFARALLKPAPFLLLDEPTAHLDPAAEAAMIASIAALRGTRTILVATHSPALAAIADRIVTLEPSA